MSKEETYDQEQQEFNSMLAYLKRIDNRSNDRDIKFNEGDPESAARTTLTLLMNCIPRFRMKFDEDSIRKQKYIKIQQDIEQIFTDIDGTRQNEDLYKRNKNFNLLKLYKANIELETLKFESGMIYPEKETKTLKEISDEDY